MKFHQIPDLLIYTIICGYRDTGPGLSVMAAMLHFSLGKALDECKHSIKEYFLSNARIMAVIRVQLQHPAAELLDGAL